MNMFSVLMMIFSVSLAGISWTAEEEQNGALVKIYKDFFASREEYCLSDILPDHVFNECHAAALAAVLKEGRSLHKLIFKHFNPLTRESIFMLADGIKNAGVLSSLRISDCHLGPECAEPLCNALAENNSITYLDLRNNKLESAGAIFASLLLKKNRCIKTMVLAGNNLADEGFASVADGLKTNSSLTKLGLCKNNAGEVGINAILEATKGHSSLKSLDLCMNKSAPNSAAAVARLLEWNCKLDSLCIEGIVAKKSNEFSLLESLMSNYTVQCMDIFDGEADLDYCYVWQQVVARNKKLLKLHEETACLVLSLREIAMPEELITLLVYAWWDRLI